MTNTACFTRPLGRHTYPQRGVASGSRSPIEASHHGTDTFATIPRFLIVAFTTFLNVLVLVLVRLLVQRRGGPFDTNHPSRVPDRHKVRANRGKRALGVRTLFNVLALLAQRDDTIASTPRQAFALLIWVTARDMDGTPL